MPAALDAFAATLRGLGQPDALAAHALHEETRSERLRVNAHVHLPPNFTAFTTTRQALELADAQGVGVLGASNYYDYAVYADLAAEAGARGIFPLFGLEIISLIDDLVRAGVRINDPGNPGKMYICGKGITRFDPLEGDAATLLQTIRDADGQRMAEIARRLSRLFDEAGIATGLDASSICQRVAARHGCLIERVYLQERHLAQAFQEVVFDRVDLPERGAFWERVFGAASRNPHDAVTVQNEIRTHLMKAGKAAFVPDTFVNFDHAYRLILALGGIPCYPTLADGATPITQYEASVEDMIADLQARGVVSAEFIPNRNAPHVLSRYVHALRDAGFFVTAGTEHNTLDLLPIAPVCLGDVPIPDDAEVIFWEGACVVAAHQYLTLMGEPGFVGSDGKPNAAYATADARIRAFARIGAAVIKRYRQ